MPRTRSSRSEPRETPLRKRPIIIHQPTTRGTRECQSPSLFPRSALCASARAYCRRDPAHAPRSGLGRTGRPSPAALRRAVLENARSTSARARDLGVRPKRIREGRSNRPRRESLESACHSGRVPHPLLSSSGALGLMRRGPGGTAALGGATSLQNFSRIVRPALSAAPTSRTLVASTSTWICWVGIRSPAISKVTR